MQTREGTTYSRRTTLSGTRCRGCFTRAGRWERLETLVRYVQGIVVGDGAMARLQMAREAGLETIPAHLRRG